MAYMSDNYKQEIFIRYIKKNPKSNLKYK